MGARRRPESDARPWMASWSRPLPPPMALRSRRRSPAVSRRHRAAQAMGRSRATPRCGRGPSPPIAAARARRCPVCGGQCRTMPPTASGVALRTAAARALAVRSETAASSLTTRIGGHPAAAEPGPRPLDSSVRSRRTCSQWASSWTSTTRGLAPRCLGSRPTLPRPATAGAGRTRLRPHRRRRACLLRLAGRTPLRHCRQARRLLLRRRTTQTS
jgi:hypothetical protein